MAYDLVIRNGTVVDGTGMAPYRADVGVAGGRITAIGRIRERGAEDIDAEGHAVTPGFIDGHTHMDAQLFWDKLGTCSSWHGITTAIMGHCGFSLAPAKPEARALVVRNLERAEDISPAALAAGMNWTWSSFAEYLDAVDKAPKGINYASNIGHSALRTWAMGERAFEGPSTEDDLKMMEGELRSALKAGAIGFTSSRTDQHETSDNRPVASRLAEWSEMRRFVGVLGDMGAGVFQFASEPAANSPDTQVRDDYYARLRELVVGTGVPTAIPMIATPNSPAVLDFVDACAEQGGRLFGLTHSRGISVLLTFKTRLPFDVLPEWKEVRDQPLERQLQLLRDPAVRARLVHAAHHGDYGKPIGAEARQPDYNEMRVLDTPMPPHRSVADVAAERGMDPVELILDLAVKSEFAQFFVQPLRHYDQDMILRTMKHPRTVMTFSDAGAHVSQIFDFSIQTHLLAWWVREKQAFTLEEAVRMLTLAPARAWGFADRGLLRVGMAADINVFDPRTVSCAMPKIESDLPAGAKRITQGATGFLATVVGGKTLFRNGQHSGALPGKLLRGPLYAQ
jgi:N-acyl-D-aspartate/D-glutamate deacylase